MLCFCENCGARRILSRQEVQGTSAPDSMPCPACGYKKPAGSELKGTQVRDIGGTDVLWQDDGVIDRSVVMPRLE